tara:strand:- start:64 stop:318 length:255 start_codon:yes stop_codon:yes gene_type:complete
MIMIRKTIVTLDILYYMPDYENLVQTFVWQTNDITPDFPRIHKFLDYWDEHIEAKIAEANIAYVYQDKMRYKKADFEGKVGTWH